MRKAKTAKKKKSPPMVQVMSSLDPEATEKVKKDMQAAAEDSSAKLLSEVLGRNKTETTIMASVDTVILVEIMDSIMLTLKSGLGMSDKARLVTYLTYAAIDPSVAKAYEKMLPSCVTSNKLWTTNADTTDVAAAFGCLLLTPAASTMSVTLKELKKKWMESNGGFADCFSAGNLLKYSEKGTGNRGLEIAYTYLNKDAMLSLISVVTKEIPSLAYNLGEGRYTETMSLFKTFISKAIAYFPSFPDNSFVKVTEAVHNALILILSTVVVIIVITALFKKEVDEGLIIKVVSLSLVVLDCVAVFLFGSREVYTCLFIIILSMIIINIWSKEDEADDKNIVQDSMLSWVAEEYKKASAVANVLEIKEKVDEGVHAWNKNAVTNVPTTGTGRERNNFKNKNKNRNKVDSPSKDKLYTSVSTKSAAKLNSRMGTSNSFNRAPTV